MNHDHEYPDDEATLGDAEDPTLLPATTDPEAVTRALGVQVHLIRTQFVRDRLASGRYTAKQITAMLEWEEIAPRDNIRLGFAGAMSWHGRLSAFDRHGIRLELREGMHVSPEQYEAAKHLHDQCRELWLLRRHEDDHAARAAIETLKRLDERLQAEVKRLATGPDRSFEGMMGALLRTPKAPATAPSLPPLEPEAREALVAAIDDECRRALAAREGLRRTCADIEHRQDTWETQRTTVDPTGVLLGSQVDGAVSEMDDDIANAYALMVKVWTAVDNARASVNRLNQALATGS